MIERRLNAQVNTAIDHFRVVVLHGGRQCGKTTLARQVTAARGGTYLTLDDPAVLEAALTDPTTFLTEPTTPVAVDEIQLASDHLVHAAKQLIDTDGSPGRFLFTGSTNFLTVPSISESLAGRVPHRGRSPPPPPHQLTLGHLVGGTGRQDGHASIGTSRTTATRCRCRPGSRPGSPSGWALG